jgi:hypothetical protein
MNARRPFVVLPFPQRRLEAATRDAIGSTNGRIARADGQRVIKGDRAIRFFRDIHGTVSSRHHHIPQDLVVCSGGNAARDQHVR